MFDGARRAALVLLVFWILTFGLVPLAMAWIGVDFTAPDSWPAAWWGLFGVLALVADIVLAVPSGVVMAALGATYGFWGGWVLGVIGSSGATIVGWAMGRGGTALLATIPDDDPGRLAIQRWGVVALIVTRPIPLVGETAALISGSAGLDWRRAAAGAVLGSLPSAALYAGIGATSRAVEAPLWVPLLACAALALPAWFAGRTLGRFAS